METTLKFDRVILTKKMGEKFNKIGDMFEIASILNNSSFLLRDAKTKIAIGVVSFEDFDEHFVHEENFKGWTDWVSIIGFDGQTDAYYKTNRKKVIVKFLANKVRAEACCHRDDDFNLAFGVQMAYLRCLNKAYEKKKVEYEECLKRINCEMTDNNRIMHNMINSIEG